MEINYQPPSRGWTVTPDFDEATGEMLDPSVNYGHSATSPFADNKLELDEDYLDPDAFESHNVDDDIADALHDIYPIDEILEYVVQNYPPEYYADYDKAVDEGDWQKVNEFLERMNAEYEEANPQQEPFNREEVEQELNTLAETEPEGMEVAFELLQQAEQTSDPLESEMLQVASAFHKGDVSAETAIQSLLDKHDINQLIKTYNKLNS